MQRWLIYLALLHVCQRTKLSSPSPSPPVTPARSQHLPARNVHTHKHTLDCLFSSIVTSSVSLSCYHCVPPPSFSLSPLSYQEPLFVIPPLSLFSLLLSSVHHTFLSAIRTQSDEWFALTMNARVLGSLAVCFCLLEVQVKSNFIHIAQKHKSHFASVGFTVCRAYNTFRPETLDSGQEKLPQKNIFNREKMEKTPGRATEEGSTQT